MVKNFDAHILPIIKPEHESLLTQRRQFNLQSVIFVQCHFRQTLSSNLESFIDPIFFFRKIHKCYNTEAHFFGSKFIPANCPLRLILIYCGCPIPDGQIAQTILEQLRIKHVHILSQGHSIKFREPNILHAASLHLRHRVGLDD
jgi:hypothetical protein